MNFEALGQGTCCALGSSAIRQGQLAGIKPGLCAWLVVRE